jgi:hypothetical protein
MAEESILLGLRLEDLVLIGVFVAYGLACFLAYGVWWWVRGRHQRKGTR